VINGEKQEILIEKIFTKKVALRSIGLITEVYFKKYNMMALILSLIFISFEYFYLFSYLSFKKFYYEKLYTIYP
jgi:hypothetical protein